MTALHAGVLIASLHRGTPAPCGAFADERRVVPATKARKAQYEGRRS
jgi:hypothetical protein